MRQFFKVMRILILIFPLFLFILDSHAQSQMVFDNISGAGTNMYRYGMPSHYIYAIGFAVPPGQNYQLYRIRIRNGSTHGILRGKLHYDDSGQPGEVMRSYEAR